MFRYMSLNSCFCYLPAPALIDYLSSLSGHRMFAQHDALVIYTFYFSIRYKYTRARKWYYTAI